MKGLRRVTVAVMALLLAVACGGGGGSGPEKAGNCTIPDGNAGSGAVSGRVKGDITFQTTSLKDSFSDIFTPMIRKFEQQHPGTHVNWVDDPGTGDFQARQLTSANGCSMADVINLNSTTALALTDAGFLMNVDQKAPGISTPFIRSVWDTSTLPGHPGHYMLPWYWAPLVQTFNTDLMKRAGLDVDHPPTTVMGQLAMAKQIAERAHGAYYAFLANPINPNSARVPGDWQVMGAKIINQDHSKFTFASDPSVLKWLTTMRDLYKAGAMPADSISQDQDPSQLYSQGKLVWGSPIPSFLRYVKQNAPTLYPVTGVAPGIWDARGFASFEGQYVSVPVTSKNPATALAFARFLLSTENQLLFDKDPKVAIFPSTTEGLADPYFQHLQGEDAFPRARQIAAQEAKTAKVVTLWEWTDAVNKAVGAELQLAIQGQEDPRTALQAAQDKADRLLTQARRQGRH